MNNWYTEDRVWRSSVYWLFFCWHEYIFDFTYKYIGKDVEYISCTESRECYAKEL